MQPRSERILDAAIQVVGTEGIRALTHRAVDAAAGLPAGSTSNLFRTRDALLRALMTRMVDAELASWDHLALAAPTTVDGLTDLLTAAVGMLTGPLRTLTVARYALFLEAARDPALQAEIGRAADRIAAIGIEWLTALGSAQPRVHVAILMACLDGLVVHELAFPTSMAQRDVTVELRTLLRALVDHG